MKLQKVIMQIIFLVCLIAAFMLVRSYENPQVQTSGNITKQTVDYKDRVSRLEPEIPLDINYLPFLNPPLPSGVISCEEILGKGQEIPFETVYSNPEWRRPIYRAYWHSTVSAGRWSYVPNRTYYAMHRLFTTYMTASVYYDFIHDTGIAEESNAFKYNATEPYEKIMVVAMQTEVQKVLTLGNQVVIVGKPQRNGLCVLTIPTEKIKPEKPDDNLLFQLSTVSGGEIDYSIISYAKW